MPKKQFVCTTCGFVGKPVTITKGSIWLEIILWLALLVPGIVYSIWRLSTRYKGCPESKKDTMIPVDTPLGQKLISEITQKDQNVK